MPLEDMFWGDRWGMIVDPYGHNWSVASTVREVSAEELQSTIDNMDMTACGPDAGKA
jgi:PhnB protein